MNVRFVTSKERKKQELGNDEKKKQQQQKKQIAKTATKNKISRNYNLAHFVLTETLSPKKFTQPCPIMTPFIKMFAYI